MDKKRFYHTIEWLVALAACAYLIYRLAIYDDYATLWITLSSMSYPQLCAILLCITLMPLNMSLEAWRWKTLIPMSWREAHLQVYYSKLAGLITPWRLGEYPARGLLMAKEQPTANSQQLIAKVLSMGAVGSATMTAAIIASGLISLGFLGVIGNLGGLVVLNSLTYFILIGAVLLLLVLALCFAPRLLRRWAIVSHPLILISLAQSFLRLLCWCLQLGLVLWALNSFNFQLSTFNLFIYYLLVTVTPNVPLAEVGVRGAWAIWVFGSVNAALAGVLLWAINTLLPCLIWPFLRKKQN